MDRGLHKQIPESVARLAADEQEAPGSQQAMVSGPECRPEHAVQLLMAGGGIA